MAMQITPDGKVDRQIVTPFHLKLFYRTGGFHRLEEFPTSSSTAVLPPHLQIYTWPSCSLRELSHLLVSALPSLIQESDLLGTRLSYRLIFPDTRESVRNGPGRWQVKELGDVIVGAEGGVGPSEEESVVITAGPMAGVLGGEPSKTLQDARFVIGDYIDCAVFLPGNGSNPDGYVEVGRRGGREYSGSGRGAPREEYDRFGGRGGGGRGGGFRGGRSGESWGVPSGDWRRGERLPDGGVGRGYGGRGRGRGY